VTGHPGVNQSICSVVAGRQPVEWSHKTRRITAQLQTGGTVLSRQAS